MHRNNLEVYKNAIACFTYSVGEKVISSKSNLLINNLDNSLELFYKFTIENKPLRTIWQWTFTYQNLNIFFRIQSAKKKEYKTTFLKPLTAGVPCSFLNFLSTLFFIRIFCLI